MTRAYLRKATVEDMDLIYEWANEAVVRANSFSTSIITYEEHCGWYHKLLADEYRQQYIYMYDNEEIGQARVVVVGTNAKIGYSISADKRGMGHGKLLLELLKEQIKIDYPNVRKLAAKVKPQNIASQKAFQHVGYVEVYRDFEIDLDNCVIREDVKTLFEG